MGDDIAGPNGAAPPAGRRSALGLAGSWCVVFAGMHVYWALGGAGGLAESAGVELASTRPGWFVGVGLWGVAGLLIVAATGLGLLARSGGPRSDRRRPAFRVVAVVGALLLLRGLLLELALPLDLGGVASAIGPEQTRWSTLLWNPWFMVGGVAFVVASTSRNGPVTGRPARRSRP